MRNFVYISGPIKGIPDRNKKAFADAAELLRKSRKLIINPNQDEIPGFEWEDYLRKDIAQIAINCDTIFMLPGWTKSKGACLEYHVAKELGLTILFDEKAEKEEIRNE